MLPAVKLCPEEPVVITFAPARLIIPVAPALITTWEKSLAAEPISPPKLMVPLTLLTVSFLEMEGAEKMALRISIWPLVLELN